MLLAGRTGVMASVTRTGGTRPPQPNPLENVPTGTAGSVRRTRRTTPVAAERAPAGFAEDVVALVPRLRAYARALTRDPDAADDLAQDTVVLALRAWHQFTPGTNLEGWLLTIERNRFRSLRTRRHVAAEVGVDELGPLASVPAFQEGRAELRDFKAAFARLSSHHREALVLRAVHGLSYEQVAEVAGCAVGTVKSRINRARTTLEATLLSGEGPDGDGRRGGRGPGSGGRRIPRSRDRPAARPFRGAWRFLREVRRL